MVAASSPFALGQNQSATDLVQQALHQRDIVKSSELQVTAAKNTAASLGALPLTRLEAGSGTRPDVNGGEDLTLFQPIDFFGKSRAARESGNAGVQTALATLRQTKIQVQGDVLNALANAWNSKSRLDNARSQLEIANTTQKATKTRVDVRALPEIQLTRANLDVRRAEQIVIDREAAHAANLVKLRQALGGELPPLPSSSIVLPSPGNLDKDRPELLTLNSQREGFIADEKQAKLSLAPDVEIQARRSPWAENERYGVRLQFVVPLWDHGASKRKLQAARQQADATELAYQDTKKQVMAEIQAANINQSAAKKSLESYVALASGAKDLLDKTQRGFELGASTLLDVLDAKRAYSDALDDVANAEMNLNLANAELLRANGQILGERA